MIYLHGRAESKQMSDFGSHYHPVVIVFYLNFVFKLWDWNLYFPFLLEPRPVLIFKVVIYFHEMLIVTLRAFWCITLKNLIPLRQVLHESQCSERNVRTIKLSPTTSGICMSPDGCSTCHLCEPSLAMPCAGSFECKFLHKSNMPICSKIEQLVRPNKSWSGERQSLHKRKRRILQCNGSSMSTALLWENQKD